MNKKINVSHKELVDAGATWLNKKAPNVFYKCQFVCKEMKCLGTNEIPDIIGLRPTGSILIEVKISIADFRKDRNKKGRDKNIPQLGKRKLYLAPKGLIETRMLPDSWGLLEWNGNEIELTKHSSEFVESKESLNFIYHSILRRSIKPQVFSF